MTTAAHGALDALPAGQRDRFLALGHEVFFARGTRIFEEGRKADRFWIIRSGAVALDLHVPGRHSPIIETIGPGELLGWSWMFAPYRWHLGAQTLGPVRAHEFDATAVHELCEEDSVLGQAWVSGVASVIAQRLKSARTRLLDLYGPYGSGAAL